MPWVCSDDVADGRFCKPQGAGSNAENRRTVRGRAVNNESSDRLLGFLGLAIIGVGIWIYSAGGIEAALFSWKYWVTPDKVHVDAKPSDCNFFTAPLGDKGCHYDMYVNAYNAAGALVTGDFAPKNMRPPSDPKIVQVIVTWSSRKPD
jgi:hypothetical protein